MSSANFDKIKAMVKFAIMPIESKKSREKLFTMNHAPIGLVHCSSWKLQFMEFVGVMLYHM